MSCRLHVDRANLFCRKNSWMIKAFQFSSRKMQTLERPSDPAAWASGYEWSEEPGGGHQETSWEKSGRVMAVKHKRVPDIDLPPNNRMSYVAVRFRRTGINTERPLAKLCDHAFSTATQQCHSLYWICPSLLSKSELWTEQQVDNTSKAIIKKYIWFWIFKSAWWGKKCPCRHRDSRILTRQ